MSRSVEDPITDGALALLALKSAPSSPTAYTYDRHWDRNDNRAIAKVSTRGVEVYMRHATNGNDLPQIIVGRRHHPTSGLSLMTSPGNNVEPVVVDLELGDNNYVSRKHLKIYYEKFDGKFYLRCLGKNGILVDDTLIRNNSDPMELPDKCVMRFPSTQIKLNFTKIESPHKPAEQDQLLLPQGQNEQVYRNDSNGTGGGGKQFFSPCPSPTGTMSAVNSCPTSPRNGAGVQGTYGESDFHKPPFSYAQLIVQAIGSTSDRQMTLSGIYSYIQRNYPYYRTADRGWQNSIRHNLSLNRYFLKVPRNHDEPGKGSYWRIEPQSEGKLIEQAFRKRRHRTITAVRSPQPFRSAPPSPTHNGTKDQSPQRGQSAELDFASAPNSPSRSEPGSATTVSMPSTPSASSQGNGAFLFPHPAFAQFKPNQPLRGFSGFFFAQTNPNVLPSVGSPTFFLPNVDAYQMPPPPQNAYKRPSSVSDEEDPVTSSGGDQVAKKSKVEFENDSGGSSEELDKSAGVVPVPNDVSPVPQ